MNINEIGNIESNYGSMSEDYDSEQVNDYLTGRTEDAGPREIELDKIDNIEFDDVNMNDSPDFSDAFIKSADMDGTPMTEDELEQLNENRGYVYQKLIDELF